MLLLWCSIYILNFCQDYFWMLQFTGRFSSLNNQAYWKKRSRCYLSISKFLKTLVWLLSFWIEYGNNYQLSCLPESNFHVYLSNLRWCHKRFQILRRCYRDIFNFPILNVWEIDLLCTCYIHASFPICSICGTVELEVPIPIFSH